MPFQPQTLPELLEVPPAEQTAVISPEHDLHLSYADLRRYVDQTAAALRSLGIKRGDTIAFIAPNGPEFLVGYLGAVAAGAACQPINAQLTAQEVDFAVEDSRAALTVVLAGSEATLQGTAIPTGRRAVLSFDGQAIAVEGRPVGSPAASETASADDDALVLYTSGTTSRPKAVPLTHANLLTSARNVAASYALTADDVTLCVMPLFHVHGLVASAFATLASGGTLILPARFSASAFWDEVRRYGATWYTAVPTIHTILLAAAGDGTGQDTIRRDSSKLRFVRSCSSALAAATQERFEETFGVPLLQAYGMTEAAHQMATNPLPPGTRKPNSVGKPYGLEIAILDDAGAPVTHGAVGEVCIRGANVTRGYLRNPAANEAAFSNGWFRTGDNGYLDAEGYLFLSGRLKELINRGGEKISPYEVDDALLRHPAVQEAVAVAVPHPIYGEEVEAVVALKPGASVSEKELIHFAGEQIARFKVPKAIRFVPAIPRSATGKVQRRRLLELLG